MQFKDLKSKSPGINITSLIDVMFILIIFFMVSSSIIEQPGMKLELPRTKSAEVVRMENIALFISREGEIFVNRTPVALDSLASILQQVMPKLAEKTLVLKADKASHHGTIVQIMDIAKRAGIEKIVIGTEINYSE